MDTKTQIKEIKRFVKWARAELGIQGRVVVRLRLGRMQHGAQSTFGGFDLRTGKITVSVKDRHLLDVLRTIAHEMCHQRQAEIKPLSGNDGKTGSAIENQANSVAGILLRNWGKTGIS